MFSATAKIFAFGFSVAAGAAVPAGAQGKTERVSVGPGGVHAQ